MDLAQCCSTLLDLFVMCMLWHGKKHIEDTLSLTFPFENANYLVDQIDKFMVTYHVEMMVKLSLKKDTPRIEETMEPDEESNYTPKEKATYQKIKDYVKDKFGVNVHTSYIAQVKRMSGLDMDENYNKSKKENPEVKQCSQEKVEFIKDELRYYKLILFL